MKFKGAWVGVILVIFLSAGGWVAGKIVFETAVKNKLMRSLDTVKSYIGGDIIRMEGIKWSEERDLTTNFFLIGGTWETELWSYNRLVRADYIYGNNFREVTKLFVDYSGEMDGV